MHLVIPLSIYRSHRVNRPGAAVAEGRPVNAARIGCIPCPEKKRTISDKQGISGTGGDSGGSEVTPRVTPLSSELATGSVTAGVPRRPRYRSIRPAHAAPRHIACISGTSHLAVGYR